MMVPVILFGVSAALAGVAAWLFGPVASDLMLLALVSALASLILILLRLIQGPQAPSGGGPARWLLVDGSNVMHWKDEGADLATLREVLQDLTARGFRLGVIFDANVGYKIGDRYQDDANMARKLGLPVARVLVVPKGTQADPFLLKTARELGARVVTNDRFRDWAEAHPEVRQPGFLIRGGYRDGRLWLDEVALEAEAVGG